MLNIAVIFFNLCKAIRDLTDFNLGQPHIQMKALDLKPLDKLPVCFK